MGSRGGPGYSRARTITLIIALATLTSNILSSLLFSQFPDDPYHVAVNFGWYLHVANVLSVFGFLGALREHALSIAIFSNYLILDSLISTVPRFLLLSLLQPLSATLCAEASSSSHYPSHSYVDSQQQWLPSSFSSSENDVPLFNTNTNTNTNPNRPSFTQWDSLSAYTTSRTPEACLKIVVLAQVTLATGVVVATLLQFVGALCVRQYARCLWLSEMRDEERIVESLGRGEGRFVEEGKGGNRLEVIIECAEEEEKIVG